MKPTILIAMLSLVAGYHAMAHQDPVGDIHPLVCVSNNQFIVTFRSQNPPEWKREHKRMLFDANGQRIGEPEVIPAPKRSDQVARLPVRLPEECSGLILSDGTNSFFVVPEWNRKHKGKPFIIAIRGNKQTEIRPDWQHANIDIVHDAILSPRYIVLLVTEVGAKDFGLVAINRQTGRILKRCSLGEPARIYNFSVNSNLLEHNGDIYLTWVKPNAHSCTLTLSKWNPDKNTLVSSALPNKTTWNTSLSMARIGDHTLLAYHYASEYPGKAKIITIEIDLTKAFTLSLAPRAQGDT